MTLVSAIGFLSAFLTTGAFVPQALKTIKSKSTEDLSLVTFSMIFIGTLLWLIYGFCVGDVPIMLANAVTALLAGVILVVKVRGMMGE